MQKAETLGRQKTSKERYCQRAVPQWLWLACCARLKQRAQLSKAWPSTDELRPAWEMEVARMPRSEREQLGGGDAARGFSRVLGRDVGPIEAIDAIRARPRAPPTASCGATPRGEAVRRGSGPGPP